MDKTNPSVAPTRDRSGRGKRCLATAAAAVLSFHGTVAHGGMIKTLTGSVLNTPANWSPSGVPTIANDVLIGTSYPTASIPINVNATAVATTLTFNSFNFTNPFEVTLYNYTAANSNAATIVLGGAGSSANTVSGAAATDLFYVASGSTFNMSTGTSFGTLNLTVGQSGSFNVGGNATLTNITNAAGQTFTKTGDGTLTLAGANSTSFAGQIVINAGTLAYTSAATSPATGATVTLGGGTLRYLNTQTTNQIGTNGRQAITLATGTTSTLSVVNSNTGAVTNERVFNVYGGDVAGENISGSGNLVIGGSTATRLSGVVFNKAHTYNGTTTVGQFQSLLLTASGSAVNSALTLSNGTLFFNTARTATSTFSGITLAAGASAIRSTAATAADGSSTAANLATPGTVTNPSSLGTFTRNAGGTVDFQLPSSGSFTTPTANFGGGGILGGYATQGNGASFVTSAGNGTTAGAITALLAASTDYNTAGDLDAAGSGTFGSPSVNSIRFTSGSTATIADTLSVNTGGILVTSAGTTPTLITGGNGLTSGNGADLIVHQYNTAAATTIASPLTDNGASPVGLTKTGPGTLILDGANTRTGATYISGGTLQVGTGGTTGGIAFNQPVVNQGTLVINRSDNMALTGLVSGVGGLRKAGTGVLTVSNASNSFTGPIEVQEGVLAFSSTLAVNGNSTLNNITINDGAAVRFTNNSPFTLVKPITLAGGNGTIETSSSTGSLTTDSAISGTGKLVKTGPGQLNLNAGNSFTGGLQVAAGTLRVSDTGALGPSGVSGSPAINQIDSGATLSYNIGVDYTGFRSILLGGTGNATIAVDSGSTTTFRSNTTVNGAAKLVKTGPGALVLSAANDYSGGTLISAGNIRANYATQSATVSSTGTGPVAINSGGLLGGTGYVAGEVTVNSGGTISAGTSVTTVGQLKTLGGGQVWKGGGIFNSKFLGTATATSGYDTQLTSALNLTDLSAANRFNLTLTRASGTYTLDPALVYTLATITGTVGLPTGYTLPAAGASVDLTDLFVLNTTAVGVADSSPYSVLLFGQADMDGGFDLNLNFQAAPEPTTAVLVGLGVAPLFGRRRRNSGSRSVLSLLGRTR